MSRALADGPLGHRVWVVAIGKAAVGMAQGALDALARGARSAAGGIVIGPRDAEPRSLPIPWFPGDHPLPDGDSCRAADALGETIARVAAGDEVWILLSGGTTSLVGAPVAGIPLAALREVFRAISRAGLNIEDANVLRRRFLRWGGGRLGAALSHSRVQVLAISDVPGDDPATIGSGPCMPDPLTDRDIASRFERHGLLDRLPAEVVEWLDRPGGNDAPAPPGIEAPPHRIILRNADALQAAAHEARRRNYFADVLGSIGGEASEAGARIGARLRSASPGSCLLWGGESTVTLGGTPGRGGRSQELALAAAMEIAGTTATLLAAGTDGRDGPTDAAGAIVDGDTMERLRAASTDVAAALARHDVYPVLNRIGALFRPGPTGTNVMDVVIGLVPR